MSAEVTAASRRPGRHRPFSMSEWSILNRLTSTIRGRIKQNNRAQRASGGVQGNQIHGPRSDRAKRMDRLQTALGHGPRLPIGTKPAHRERLAMFTSEQYRAKASEYAKLVGIANGPNEMLEFQRLERSFTELADNAQWAIDNYDNTLHGARRRDEQGAK